MLGTFREHIQKNCGFTVVLVFLVHQSTHCLILGTRSSLRHFAPTIFLNDLQDIGKFSAPPLSLNSLRTAVFHQGRAASEISALSVVTLLGHMLWKSWNLTAVLQRCEKKGAKLVRADCFSCCSNLNMQKAACKR